MHRQRARTEIPGKKQIILKFVGDPNECEEEPPEVRGRSSAALLRALLDGIEMARSDSMWSRKAPEQLVASGCRHLHTAPSASECAFCHTSSFGSPAW